MKDGLDEMQLPKINKRKQLSRCLQNALELKILELVKELEVAEGYEFEAFEVDNVLLSLVKRNHEAYLRMKFDEG